MDYSNHPSRESSSWIIEQLDLLLGEDKKINTTTTTTTTKKTIVIRTTTETTNNTREDDGGASATTTTTTPPPPTTTSIEEERKLAQILTPLWYRESEDLSQNNLIVLTNSLKKIENLKAEVKKRDDLLKRLADLTEEKLERELREKAYYERYP